MAEKLLPCPFCAGDAIICGNNEHNPRHWVMCANCHACPGGDVTKKADAISAWNHRITSLKPVVWLRRGNITPIQNVPLGAMWITDKEDPHGFAVYDAPPSGSVRGIRIAGWVNEDELPESYPYDVMFQHSKVDGVRLFPVYAPEEVSSPIGKNKIGQTAIQRAQSDFMEFMAQDGYLDTDRCLEPKSASYIQTLLDNLCEAARRDLRLELAATIREGISAVADARSAKDSPVSILVTRTPEELAAALDIPVSALKAPPVQHVSGVADDKIEQVAKALASNMYPDTRWPADEEDANSGVGDRQSRHPISWHFANVCRRQARAAVAAFAGTTEGSAVCPTCDDTGKEGRHSICRDCDENPTPAPRGSTPQ